MRFLFESAAATDAWAPSAGEKKLTAVAAFFFGLLVYALLPQGIVALNDDFGYLRSVVATLQHGRPWTDDWLEPWSAGLTSLSAVLFTVTHSFYFATYGLLAILAGTAFFLAARLLVDRGLSAVRASLVVCLGLTFPTILWKEVQFTGMALYIPCLLGALGAAERRRWGWFFVAWLLAFSTRQSALAWAVLPAMAIVEDWRRGRLTRRQWLVPALVMAAGAVCFLLLAAGMNKTLAQRVVTDSMWSGWHPAQAWRALLVGGAVLLAAAGWGALARQDFVAADSRSDRQRLLSGACWLAAAALLWVNARDHVAVEFDTLDTRGGFMALKVFAVAGFAGLALGNFGWRPLPLAGALAALAVLSFRSTMWDYYLLDAALFGFLAVGRGHAAIAVRPLARWLLPVAAGALAIFQVFALLQVKSTLDRTHAMIVLGSQAIEQGKVPPDHASFLPFGLMAWYYFPAYAQRMEPGDTDLADFGRYLKQDGGIL